MIVVALRAEDCFIKALDRKLRRKEHSICTLLMIEQTLIALAFTSGQPKPTKLWKKTCNTHRQQVAFHAGHAESTTSLNSENWVHELLIPQVQYYSPAPTNMKKHLRVTSDEEKLVSLLCECVLIDHGFRDRTLLPAHPLAKKSLKQLLMDLREHSQPDVFLVFSRTGNPLVKTVFLRGQRKLTKNSSTDFTLLATIVTIVAEQPNFDAQEAQYTTKTTTSVATETDEENKQNSEFSLVYFLALFLSLFKCAIFQRSLRQRRDALNSYLVLAKSFALFLAKNFHLSFSPLEGRWDHTFRCQKRFALWNSSRSSFCFCQMGVTADRSTETNGRISGCTNLLFIEKMNQIKARG